MPLGSTHPRDHPPRPRAYLSSTFTDLTDCRAAVHTALERLGVEVVAMESYTAANCRPADKCQADVRACDLYIGIFALSYGSIPEGEDRSFTELEYRAAEAADMPRLVFLLDEDALWPPRFVDRGAEYERIERLRTELGESHLCSFFTDATKLAELVTASVANWLREQRPEQADPMALALPEWDAYRRRLVQEYRRLDLEALTPPELEDYLQIELRNVFVEPEVRESISRPELPKELWRKLKESAELSAADVPYGLEARRLAEIGQTHQQQIAQPVFKVLAGPGGRRCVLLGDPGSGKSTLARYLALSLAEGDPGDDLDRLTGLQPLLIELREYALDRTRYETFGAYLDYRARSDGLGIPADALQTHLEQGDTLVIFDGLDELFVRREREVVSRQIVGFAEAHPRARVVVTSRIIGYESRILDDAGFRHYTIEDLDRDRIGRFLDSWYRLALRDRPSVAAQRHTRLTKAIEDTPAIRDLAGNPLLLTILAIIGKHKELPRERSEVYDHAAGVLVHHWDVNRHLSDAHISADTIRENDKKELLRRLAYRMQRGADGAAGNFVWDEDLELEILAFLHDRFDYPRPEARGMARAMIEQLRVRNFVLARYGPRVYGFVHRALLEYFCAAEIVARFEKARELSEDDLRAIFAEYWEDPSWAEVLRLVAGMVHPSVADRLVRHLLTNCPPRRTAVLERPAAGAVALAFQCLAEVRAVSGCKQAAAEAQQALIGLLLLPHTHVGAPHGPPLFGELLTAVRSMGSGWPGRWTYWEWFENEGRHLPPLPGAAVAAGIAAAMFSDRPEVRDQLATLAADSHLRVQRAACLQAVAETWSGEKPVRALALRLLRDTSMNVRVTAVTMLAEHFADGDDGTVRAAIHEMLADPWFAVHNAALRALATRWTEHPDTLPAMMAALSGPMGRKHAYALDLASTYFGDHDIIRTAILAILQGSAWPVRREALRTLASQWTDAADIHIAVRFCLRDPDEDVREAAVQALATRWPDADDAFPAVRSALRDPDAKVRRAAVEALVRGWPERSATRVALEVAERDPDGAVRIAALLGRFEVDGEVVSIPTCLHETCHDPDPSIRVAALETLIALEPSAPDTRDAALSATRDPEPNARRTALNALVDHWGQNPDTATAVLRAIRDTSRSVRYPAVQAMATRMGDHSEALAAMVAATHDEDGAVRRAAVAALAVRWPDRPESQDALRRALHDPEWSVRDHAVDLSAAQRTVDVVEARGVATCDPSFRVRDTAIELCPAPQATHKPATTLRHTEPWLRRSFLRALARSSVEPSTLRDSVAAAQHVPSPDARGTVLELLIANGHAFTHAEWLSIVDQASRDLDGRIRYWALWCMLARDPAGTGTAHALGRAQVDAYDDVRRDGLEAAIGGLAKARTMVMVACRSPDPVVCRRAVHALTTRWRDHPETRPYLVDSLRHPDRRVRHNALDALCEVWPDHPDTAVALRRAVVDPSPMIRSTAIESAAVLLRDASDTADLLMAAVADPSETIRVAAQAGLRALGTVGPVIATLLDAIAATRDPDTTRCLHALWTLVTRWPEDPDTRVVLERLVHHRDREVRTLALHTLTTTWAEDPRTPSTLHTLLATDPPASADAAPALVAGWPETPNAAGAALWSIHHYGYAEQQDIAALAGHQPEQLEEIRQVLCQVAEAPLNDVAMHEILTSLRISWPTHPATRRTIQDAAHSPAAEVRRSAVEALVLLGSEGTDVLAQLEHAHTDPDPEVRATARQQMALRDPAEQAVLAPPWNDLADPIPAVRADAVLRLAQWSDHPDAESAIDTALGDPHPTVRTAAIQQLPRLRPQHPGTPGTLRAAATDPDAGVRVAALTALAEYHPTDAQTGVTLRQAATDPHPEVRRVAVDSLAIAWGDDPTAVSLLHAAAQDSDDAVQRRAMHALALRGLVGEADHRRVLSDPNRIVGNTEVRAWIQSLPPNRTDLPELLRRAGNAISPETALRAVVALAEHWSDHTEAADVLSRAATQGDELGQRLALEALAESHSHLLDAAEIAQRARTDPFVEIRDWAVDYLVLHSEQSEPAEAILAACQDDTPRVRRTALRRLVTRWPHLPQTRRAAAAAIDDPSLMVATIAATAHGTRWHVDPDARRCMERFASRPDVPSEFVRWWEWASTCYPDPPEEPSDPPTS